MYTEITACRICGGKELASLFRLNNQFLTGVFPKSEFDKVTSGPVELLKCTSKLGCGLVQLKQSYDLNEMYGFNYGYRSGLNESMVMHLHSKVKKIIEMGLLRPGDLIIDIGSNDCTTLKAYPKGIYNLVGIDPSGIKFSEYYPPEISLISDFFSSKLVTSLHKDKKAKIITSFSMFYDLEDPLTFAKEVESSLDDNGLWIFEQSYLPSMLQTNSFDTICHEHLEFYSLKQIFWIADHSKLKVLDVEFNEINGGSFSVICSKLNSTHIPNFDLLNKVVSVESAMGLDSLSVYEDFNFRVQQACNTLLEFLREAKDSGKSVLGLGASTKGNVLLQYCGVDRTFLPLIGEVNEDKFGSFTPGTLIPLVPESKVLALNPDYLLVLPWHFRPFFEKLPSLKGRKLVFPLPIFEIVEV